MVRWYELPEGTIPLYGDPNDDFVLTSDRLILPEDEYRAAKAAG